MASETLVYEFERQFREVEGIKIVVRRPRNEIATPYNYAKKLSGASTISKLRERVVKQLGHNDFDLLDVNMNELHGLNKLAQVREAQKDTLLK